MKNELMLLVVASVVFASGCVVPGTDIDLCNVLPVCGDVNEDTDDVVIIKSLTATPNTVSPEQEVIIRASVQNVGRTKFSTDATGDADIKEPIIVSLYDYCQGLFTYQRSNIGACTPNDEKGKVDCTIDSLLPQQIKSVDFVIKPKGDVRVQQVCPPDGMKVYVRYHYKTVGSSTISFINQEEYQRQLDSGTFQETESQISAGQGPLKAFITVEDQQPITSYEGAQATIALQLKNRGAGFVVDGAVRLDKITITSPDTKIEDDIKKCMESWGEEKRDNPGVRLVTLIGKESAKQLCKIDVPDYVEKVTTKTINIEMDYEYEFRDYEKVTVRPPFFV